MKSSSAKLAAHRCYIYLFLYVADTWLSVLFIIFVSSSFLPIRVSHQLCQNTAKFCVDPLPFSNYQEQELYNCMPLLLLLMVHTPFVTKDVVLRKGAYELAGIGRSVSERECTNTQMASGLITCELGLVLAVFQNKTISQVKANRESAESPSDMVERTSRFLANTDSLVLRQVEAVQ
jgi:hypothetical protein